MRYKQDLFLDILVLSKKKKKTIPKDKYAKYL